jgi:dihydrofolate synthase/folylpolyglutamate synthase
MEVAEHDLDGQEIAIWHAGEPEAVFKCRLALLGDHQAQNAAIAYEVLKRLEIAGIAVTDTAIAEGFATVQWPGRFEVLQKEPPIVLDAAHTPSAAQALRTTLDTYFPDEDIVLLMGVSGDKDVAGLIEPLADRVAVAFATQSSHPRAMPAKVLLTRLEEQGVNTEAIPEATAGFEKAPAALQSGQMLLVFGSAFLVEELRASWLARR